MAPITRNPVSARLQARVSGAGGTPARPDEERNRAATTASAHADVGVASAAAINCPPPHPEVATPVSDC